MLFALLTLLAALALAAVAGWFSIIGIMSIYAGARIQAMIMGVVLECAALVTTSWLYRNWKFANWKLKVPLIVLTVFLMLATNIGVFGFLSKAHLEQGAGTIDNGAKVERLEQQITREKSVIADNEKVIAQLDATINSYIGKDRTDKSVAIRRSQEPQRKQLRADIDAAQKRIDGFSDEKLKLQSEVRKMQLEVGPIRYIAELIYGVDNNTDKNIEAAVRIFTLLIVMTLDPLAVILLIAANQSLMRWQDEKKQNKIQEEKDTSGSGIPEEPRDIAPADAEITHLDPEAHVSSISNLPIQGYDEVVEPTTMVNSEVNEEIQVPVQIHEIPVAAEATLNEEINTLPQENSEVHESQVYNSVGEVSRTQDNGPTEKQTETELDAPSEALGEVSEEENDILAYVDQTTGGIRSEPITPPDGTEDEGQLPVQEQTVGTVNEEAETPDDSDKQREGNIQDVMHAESVASPDTKYLSEILGDRLSGIAATTFPTEALGEVNEEDETALEDSNVRYGDSFAPPIILQPSYTRVSRYAKEERAEADGKEKAPIPDSLPTPIKQPWAHNESVLSELIGNQQHFIPQKIMQPTPVQNVEQNTDSTVKYPKSLSWLNEFKRP